MEDNNLDNPVTIDELEKERLEQKDKELLLKNQIQEARLNKLKKELNDEKSLTDLLNSNRNKTGDRDALALGSFILVAILGSFLFWLDIKKPDLASSAKEKEKEEKAQQEKEEKAQQKQSSNIPNQQSRQGGSQNLFARMMYEPRQRIIQTNTTSELTSLPLDIKPPEELRSNISTYEFIPQENFIKPPEEIQNNLSITILNMPYEKKGTRVEGRITILGTTYIIIISASALLAAKIIYSLFKIYKAVKDIRDTLIKVKFDFNDIARDEKLDEDTKKYVNKLLDNEIEKTDKPYEFLIFEEGANIPLNREIIIEQEDEKEEVPERIIIENNIISDIVQTAQVGKIVDRNKTSQKLRTAISNILKNASDSTDTELLEDASVILQNMLADIQQSRYQLESQELNNLVESLRQPSSVSVNILSQVQYYVDLSDRSSIVSEIRLRLNSLEKLKKVKKEWDRRQNIVDQRIEERGSASGITNTSNESFVSGLASFLSTFYPVIYENDDIIRGALENAKPANYTKKIVVDKKVKVIKGYKAIILTVLERLRDIYKIMLFDD